MASGSLSTYTSIQTFFGCFFAEARFGSNGGTGTPEYDVGSTTSNAVSGRTVWDSDLSNGLNSGWINVSLDAEAGGGSNAVSWTVTGGTVVPLLFSGVTYGIIDNVQIVAAVQFPAQMLWRSVLVKFYKAGVLIESFSERVGPQVDTTGATPPVAKEQVLTVVPAQTDNDKVVITGQIELVCAAGIYPGPNDIFAQIYVVTGSCVNL